MLRHRHIFTLLLALYLTTPLMAAERPNVLFILVDDYGWRDVSLEGSTFYETPNIDRIGREGMRFTQGYATCQVCSPSRVSIMTGKFPARHGITDWIGAAEGTQLETQHQVAAGPLCACSGRRRHDAGRGLSGGRLPHLLCRQVAPGRRRVLAGGPRLRHQQGRISRRQPARRLLRAVSEPEAAGRTGRRVAAGSLGTRNRAVHRSSTKTSRSWPTCPSTPCTHRSRPPRSCGTSTARRRCRCRPPEPRFIVDRTTPVRQVQDHPVYAGMIESMDEAVGIVLDTLDRLGLTRTRSSSSRPTTAACRRAMATPRRNLPLRGGKGRQWEGGIREPFYIKWPGVVDARHPRATRRSPAPISTPRCWKWPACLLGPNNTWTASAWCRCCAAARLPDATALLALSALRQPGRRTVVDPPRRRLEADPLLRRRA